LDGRKRAKKALFRVEKNTQKSLSSVNRCELLPTSVLTNRFKGSGFTFSTLIESPCNHAFSWPKCTILFIRVQ